MPTTVAPLPVKPAERQPVCAACWSPVNWCESFDKFGHDQGDDCVHTASVVQVLRAAGYHANAIEENLHNTVIDEIGYKLSDGTVRLVYTDGTPFGTRVGYTNPRDVLPVDIVKFLDDSFGPGEFFG